MKTKFKRALSSVLACAMMVAMLPALANAGEMGGVQIQVNNAANSPVASASVVLQDPSAPDTQETLLTDASGQVTTAMFAIGNTVNITVTATGYQTKNDNNVTLSASETVLLTPETYGVKYYNGATDITAALPSAYTTAKSYTFGTGIAKLPTEEPQAVDHKTFVGWSTQNPATANSLVTSIGVSEHGDKDLYAFYKDVDLLTSAKITANTTTATTLTIQPATSDAQNVPTEGKLVFRFTEAMDTDAMQFSVTDTSSSAGTTQTITPAWNTAGDECTLTFNSTNALVNGNEYNISVQNIKTASTPIKTMADAIYKVKGCAPTLTFSGAYFISSSTSNTVVVQAGDTIDLEATKYDVEVGKNETFDGWYTGKDGKGTQYKKFTPSNSTNITLYANFTPNKSSSTGSSSNEGTVGKVYPRLDKTRTGYISGYSNGSIKPKASMTRAEVATMFYRMLNDSTISAYSRSTNNFTDVSDEFWANTAISTLTKAGVLKGYEDGSFKPNATITRAEFVTIITRLESNASQGQTTPTDISGHWAEQSIVNSINWNLANGYPDGTFKPDNAVTRAEAIAMVNRLMARNITVGGLPSTMKTFTDNQDTTAWYYLDIQIAAN